MEGKGRKGKEVLKPNRRKEADERQSIGFDVCTERSNDIDDIVSNNQTNHRPRSGYRTRSRPTLLHANLKST